MHCWNAFYMLKLMENGRISSQWTKYNQIINYWTCQIIRYAEETLTNKNATNIFEGKKEEGQIIDKPDFDTQNTQGESKQTQRTLLRVPRWNMWIQGIRRKGAVGLLYGTEKTRYHYTNHPWFLVWIFYPGCRKWQIFASVHMPNLSNHMINKGDEEANLQQFENHNLDENLMLKKLYICPQETKETRINFF